MAKLTREPLTKLHLQLFRGGKNHLSGRTKSLLRSAYGTEMGKDLEGVYDRLPSRMRFDNSLAHENPHGANQKWDFLRDPRKAEMVDHLNRYFIGKSESESESESESKPATIGVLAPPSYSLVKTLGISVRNLPDGLTFSIGSRFGTLKSNVPCTWHKVTIEHSQTVGMLREYDFSYEGNLAEIKLRKEANQTAVNYVIVFDTPVFMAQADEIMLVASGSITDSNRKFTEKDFDLTVAMNYEVAIRAEE